MAEVTCARCGQTRDGAGDVGLPGELGRDVATRICAVCWSEWLTAQVRVINHYGLRPALREDRERVYAYAREFLGLGDPARRGER